MPIIINGTELAKDIKSIVAKEVQQIKNGGAAIKFAAILVGEDPASKIYVNLKEKECKKIGIDFQLHQLPANCQQSDIVKLIESLSDDNSVNGILLQLPLPYEVINRNEEEAINKINPAKDVDGLTMSNVGKLVCGTARLAPCTPKGIDFAIRSVCPDITGKDIVIIGRSRIVGRPASLILSNANATVTLCHSKTKDLAKHTAHADIVVCAVGKQNILTEDMVKQDAIIIDVGINRLPDGKITGDVDFKNVSRKVHAITPVPGGIGPLTIAFLLHNIVEAYKIQNGR